MGYTTEFTGSITVKPPLTDAQAAWVNAFASMRRFRRNEAATAKLDDPIRKAAGIGDVGTHGCMYTGSAGNDPADPDENMDEPAADQPSLWMNLKYEEGQLVWDGSEKTYALDEWIEWLGNVLYKHFGCSLLESRISFQGDEPKDFGTLVVLKKRKATDPVRCERMNKMVDLSSYDEFGGVPSHKRPRRAVIKTVACEELYE